MMSPRSALRPFLGAAACAVMFAAPSASQEVPGHVAIEGARLVTVSDGTIERGTIVVENGLISAIGASVTTPPGAWVIDGTGLTVYPGLIDGLSTVGMSREDAPPEPGPGDQRRGPPERPDPDAPPPAEGPEDRPATYAWLSAADRLETNEEDLARWRAAGVTTVVTAPSRGFFTGNAAVVNLAGDRPNDMVVMSRVAQRLNLSGGPGHRGYPASIAGAYAYVKQLFFDAAHYANARSMYETDPRGRARPAHDQALDAVLPVQSGDVPLLFPASSATEIRRALRTSSEIGVRPVVYGAQSAYEVADELAAGDVAVLVSLDWPEGARDSDPEADTPLLELRHRLLAPTTPSALSSAGVRFAFFSDGVGASDLVSHVRKAVDAGLSHDDAVRALTLSAAEIYGSDDRIGSLEQGKIANLTVADGDLFAEGTEIQSVFVDGAQFDAAQDRLASAGAGGRGALGARGGPGARGGSTGEPGVDRDEGGQGPSDQELRSLIGPSYRVPYRTDAVTVIQNATIRTITNGTIENGSVVIRGGKIAEVGTNVSVPSGAHVIDAAGQYVMPGIIDAHTHVGGDFNEGSVNVSAMTSVHDVINPDDVNIYRALAGGVTTMNVLHGSANPIGGQNAVLKLRWGQDADGLVLEGAAAGIKFALGENPKRGGTWPATRMGVMDVIRQAFVEAKQYQADWDAYWASGNSNAIPPRRDLELEALAEIIRGERLVHAHAYRGDEILQLMRLAEEFGFRIATFQHVLEGYKVAKELAEHGAGASTFSDWWGYKMEAYDAIPYNAAIMAEKGVLVSINSDSNEEMRHLNEEAAKTVKWGGMSETDALSLITINPARQLGVDGQIGSIEVGKDADIVIFDRHPLDNFAVPQQTFVDGVLYFDIQGDAERQRAIDAEKEALDGQAPGRRVTTDEQGREGADR